MWSGRARGDRPDAPDRWRANFGWNIVEGTVNFAGSPQPGFTLPVAEYAHGTGPREGNSVTGGYVYRGPVEALRGQYIFGDFVRGNLWSFPISRISLGSTLASSQFTLRNAAFTPNIGAIGNVASFGVDQTGNLYIVDYDGEIFRIEVAIAAAQDSAPWPVRFEEREEMTCAEQSRGTGRFPRGRGARHRPVGRAPQRRRSGRPRRRINQGSSELRGTTAGSSPRLPSASSSGGHRAPGDDGPSSP